MKLHVRGIVFDALADDAAGLVCVEMGPVTVEGDSPRMKVVAKEEVRHTDLQARDIDTFGLQDGNVAKLCHDF